MSIDRKNRDLSETKMQLNDLEAAGNVKYFFLKVTFVQNRVNSNVSFHVIATL